MATHFACVQLLCEKYNIDATRLFNIDKSGFSIRSMTLGRTKCIVQVGSRGNTSEPKLCGKCEHVTFMPVISASSQIYTPIVVLSGMETNYRKRSNSTFETPAEYLPQPKYLFMRTLELVDTEIFFTWAQHFIRETGYLRRE